MCVTCNVFRFSDYKFCNKYEGYILFLKNAISVKTNFKNINIICRLVKHQLENYSIQLQENLITIIRILQVLSHRSEQNKGLGND